MVPGISVIIPAYNEAHNIERTILAVKSIPGVVQIIVVDDGSEDDTAFIARNMGVEVICLRQNRGKGQALTAGLNLVKGKYILLLDADLGETAALGEKLLYPLLNGQADMVVACLPATGHSAGFGLTLGLARYGTWLFTGKMLKAPLSGQRAFTSAGLKALYPLLPGFGVEVGLNIKAARKGMRIKELSIAMEHDATGRTLKGFFHRGRQFWHVLFALCRLAIGKEEEEKG
ncbi:MAG: glycosyltransferase family 2 protein [bacterium]|jgi:glycosyltransferase involved in cell wall biosynthesis